MGLLARAQRLIEQSQTLLSKDGNEQDTLAIEALGREIDAGFSLSTMPDELKVVRQSLIERLGVIG